MEYEKLKGYKSFNYDMTTSYKEKFEEGKIYTVKGPLKFGNSGNGFHFCLRLEDTLRYHDGLTSNIKIAEVTSLGERTEKFYDNYYDYDDMYAARTIRIDKILSRKEIVDMFLDKDEHRVKRFLSLYKLTDEKIKLYKEKYKNNRNIQNTISYYQEGDLEVYNRLTKKKRLRK